MNDTPPMPPPLAAAANFVNDDDRPLGENPEERAPIGGMLAAVEALVRQPRRVLYQLRQGGAGRITLALLLAAVVCALGYGFVVGTFSGDTQLWAAPVKIAGGLLLSALICLPSLYIFACLGGSQARLGDVAGLLAGLLALMTVLLIGFAPVAWVFSQSTRSVASMGALHLLFWIIATCFGLRFLRAGFAKFHTAPGGLRLWMIIFLLVMAQMTTALRPLVGTGDTFLPVEKKFFVAHWLQCLQ
jgi:hypothetical protein